MSDDPIPSIDPPDLERRAFAMKHSLREEAWELVADLLTATNLQRRMLLDGVPAHLTPSERKLGETILRVTRERNDARAQVAALTATINAQASVIAATREKALEEAEEAAVAALNTEGAYRAQHGDLHLSAHADLMRDRVRDALFLLRGPKTAIAALRAEQSQEGEGSVGGAGQEGSEHE